MSPNPAAEERNYTDAQVDGICEALQGEIAGLRAAIAEHKHARDTAERRCVEASAECVSLRKELADTEGRLFNALETLRSAPLPLSEDDGTPEGGSWLQPDYGVWYFGYRSRQLKELAAIESEPAGAGRCVDCGSVKHSTGDVVCNSQPFGPPDTTEAGRPDEACPTCGLAGCSYPREFRDGLDADDIQHVRRAIERQGLVICLHHFDRLLAERDQLRQQLAEQQAFRPGDLVAMRPDAPDDADCGVVMARPKEDEPYYPNHVLVKWNDTSQPGLFEPEQLLLVRRIIDSSEVGRG